MRGLSRRPALWIPLPLPSTRLIFVERPIVARIRFFLFWTCKKHGPKMGGNGLEVGLPAPIFLWVLFCCWVTMFLAQCWAVVLRNSSPHTYPDFPLRQVWSVLLCSGGLCGETAEILLHPGNAAICFCHQWHRHIAVGNVAANVFLPLPLWNVQCCVFHQWLSGLLALCSWDTIVGFLKIRLGGMG